MSKKQKSKKMNIAVRTKVLGVDPDAHEGRVGPASFKTHPACNEK
jgi:hypothetical protein